jgi:hypothetical protein
MADDSSQKQSFASRVAGVFARRGFPGRKRPQLTTQATARDVIGDDPGSIASTIPYDWGRSAGWLDSNEQFTVQFLYGTTKTPGKLLEIRRTDSVIAPAVDSRREMMAGLPYVVRPRKRFWADEQARACAIEVEARLRSMPGSSLGWWVSESYDHWFTNGHRLEEIVLDFANRIELLYIRPGLIAQFNPNDTGRGFDSVKVWDRFSMTTIDASKLSFIARLPQPGEFWGESGLRAMIATSETTYQLYSALLQALRYSMGFPYLQGAQGHVSPADKTNAMKSLSNVLKGKSDLAYFDAKISPQLLASTTPALQQFGPLAQHQDERKQAAARNALSNLGMRGVGSRSLGEVVHDADMLAVRGHLNLYMQTLSGCFQTTGSIMHKLAELSGYDPVYAPEIVIDWDGAESERKTLDHVRLVAELVRDGLMPNSPEQREWFAEQTRTPGAA